MSEPANAAEMCPTCATGGTQRYCARGRCYCSHGDCHADWQPLPPLPTTATPASTHARAWDTREESTWIDKL